MASCSDIGSLATVPDLVLRNNENEFKLGRLPTDILEGVMQRVGGTAKEQVELVSQRFAVVGHRLAWLHHHKLKVDPLTQSISVGSYKTEAVDTAAASRFLLARSTINKIEFNLCADDGGRLDMGKLRQEHCSGVMAALLSSERVSLRSLLLHQPAARLFGGSERLAVLIHRHSASLQEVGLFFGDDAMEADVCDALTACHSLRNLTASVYPTYTDGWQPALSQLIQRLQLSSLTMSDVSRCSRGLWPNPEALAAVLPTAPMLTELRFNSFHAEFTEAVDWSALGSLRLFQADTRFLRLNRGFTQAAVNRVFSVVLPSVQVLILPCELSCYVYWTLLKRVVAGFLSGADDRSLAVELGEYVEAGKLPRRRPLTEWRAAFPELSIEHFDVQTGAQAASARPTLPKEFEHAAVSQVVVMARPNESRRLTIALWQTQL